MPGVEFFSTLQHEAQARNLQFLVIGGIAINYYGYARDTADLDLLICREKRADWQNIFSQLGYTIDHDAETFIQLSPPKEGEWPIDLMLVREPTFVKMVAEAKQVEFLGNRLWFPALEHLMALKIHALKHGRPHRTLKDFQDLEGLILKNHLDPNSEKIRQLFQKYGNLDWHEKIVRSCSNT